MVSFNPLNLIRTSQDPDLELGRITAQQHGPSAASGVEQNHNQAFENHLVQNNGDNDRRNNVYGPAAQGVGTNNASLFVHDNTGPFDVENNNGRLNADNNHGTFAVGSNSLGSSFTANGNDGRIGLENNHGHYTSDHNTSLEHIGQNTQDVDIRQSNGTHQIGANTGHVNVDGLGPNGHVHINDQSGVVHQNFTSGTVMHWKHPQGVTHQPTGKPLTLHANGEDSLLHNPIGQTIQHPKKTGVEVVGIAAGALGAAAIYANNAAAVPASGHASDVVFHPPRLP